MSNIPQKIENYQLLRRIGKGGTSEVFLAQHRLLSDRQVAIKLLLSQDPEWIERFTREATITSRLRHEHIVQIFDHGEQTPYYYTVMEYIAGGSLRDALSAGKPLPLDLTVQIFQQAGTALDYAHQHGVIHRDVTPGNILLEKATHRVLLTDFGIARESGNEGRTRIDQMMGTPGYLSPEHASSATAVTHLSDLYGLGVVLFQMLSGRLPWDYHPGIVGEHGGPFIPPMALREAGITGLPDGVDRVIATMLALEPSKRYPSAEAAIAELERVLAYHNSTTVVASGGDAKKRETQGNGGTQPTIIVRSENEPHPVEVILGPDMRKGPLQEARKRMEQLNDVREITSLMDQWSTRGHFRRRLLGRQAAVHLLQHSNLYFYTLQTLYETREPVQTVEEPHAPGAQPPRERETDRWGLSLPAPQEFAGDAGGTVRLPGSTRIIACETCNGVGSLVCATCGGKGVVVPPEPKPEGTEEANVAMAPPRTTRGNSKPTAASGGSAAAPGGKPAASGSKLIPCADCKGKGSHRCTHCKGEGRLIQRGMVTWRRKPAIRHTHDDIPLDPKQRAAMQKQCAAVEVYRERFTGEARPDWLQVEPIAELVEQARAALDSDTRIVLSELAVSFIPLTEVVFDLGEKQRKDPKGEQQLVAESWYIVGFEKLLPDDWRFLDWSRVLVRVLIVVICVLVLLLGLALWKLWGS